MGAPVRSTDVHHMHSGKCTLDWGPVPAMRPGLHVTGFAADNDHWQNFQERAQSYRCDPVPDSAISVAASCPSAWAYPRLGAAGLQFPV
jgi:hypothetical protein